MPERKISSKFVLGAIALGLCVILAAIFLMSANVVLKVTGVVVLVAYLAFSLAFDWIAARANERHVEAFPHLLKNEAIGETVTVNGDFRAQADAATGSVFLHGENWKAYCSGHHVPKDGDTMIVRNRKGLTLHVHPEGSDV